MNSVFRSEIVGTLDSSNSPLVATSVQEFITIIESNDAPPSSSSYLSQGSLAYTIPNIFSGDSIHKCLSMFIFSRLTKIDSETISARTSTAQTAIQTSSTLDNRQSSVTLLDLKGP